MNEQIDIASSAASDAGARAAGLGAFTGMEVRPDTGHHMLCDRKEYNPLCIGCEVEASAARATSTAGVLVTPEVAGSPCDQCGVSDSHLCQALPTVQQAAPQQSSQPRPSDDQLWDETLRERDAYHEWADRLADAIAKWFGVDIGEHSNMNLPWSVALDSVPDASAPDLTPVIHWLESGRDAKEAAKELRLYQGRMWQTEAPQLSAAPVIQTRDVRVAMPAAQRAPWTDFDEQSIHVGDTIRHPDGEAGVVTLDPSKSGVGVWRVVYEDGPALWLGNQIGDKGRAVVVPGSTSAAAAMECTCPSGDGSLRWPCPAHTPPRAQGNVELSLLPEIPEGDRFQDESKFRKLGTGGGAALYECWADAIHAYGRLCIATRRPAPSDSERDAALRESTLREAAKACMRATPNRDKLKAIGDAAHYSACHDAVLALVAV